MNLAGYSHRGFSGRGKKIKHVSEDISFPLICKEHGYIPSELIEKIQSNLKWKKSKM